MLAPTNPAIQKIMYIRDVIIPEAKADPTTNLAFLRHPDGRASCILGRYNDALNTVVKSYEEEFGITDLEIGKLFGRCLSLDERAAVCDQIIERMVQEATI